MKSLHACNTGHLQKKSVNSTSDKNNAFLYFCVLNSTLKKCDPEDQK